MTPSSVKPVTPYQNRYRILVVEDEAESRELLSSLLEERFDVLEARDAEEALRMARQLQPDLVLLDISLPKSDGYKVCQDLRSSSETKHIPVLMVTGHDNPDSRITAFASGADDFIGKPFKAMELMARVESKIRRLEETKTEDKEVLRCGNLTLWPQRFEVRVEGNPVQVSVLEFNLIKFFVENKDRVVSRLEILSSVWGDVSMGERVVDTHLVALRRKLEGFDHTIATIYSKGYILKKPIRKPSSVQL